MDEIQSLLFVKGIKVLQASTLYGSGLVDENIWINKVKTTKNNCQRMPGILPASFIYSMISISCG
jgi:hypothetical protein